MSPSQAVLLITGAWHVPEHYNGITQALKRKNIPVICPRLLTNDGSAPPLYSLADDIRFISEIVDKEVAKGTHLTVLCHSYGGMIASALTPFAISRNSSQGGVTNLFYMTAFVPAENESLVGLLGGAPPSWLSASEYNTLVWKDARDHFFNQCSDEDAAWAESLCLQHHPLPAQGVPLECDKVAWKVIPTTYLICEEDQALLVTKQEEFVRKIQSQGADLTVLRCAADHSPFISRLEVVLDAVLKIMGQD